MMRSMRRILSMMMSMRKLLRMMRSMRKILRMMRSMRRRATEGATDWGVGAGIIRLVAGTHYPTLSSRAIICHFFFCNIIHKYNPQ